MSGKMACAAVLFTAATGLAGCGSTPAEKANALSTLTTGTTPVARTSFDPCGVLSAEAVTAVTGDKVTKTDAIDHDCSYRSNASDDGTKLSIYPTDGRDEMKNIKDANKVLGGIGNVVAMQGDVGKDVRASIVAPDEGGKASIADEQVWSANDVLAVRKGDMFVQVTPPIAHDPARHLGFMISSGDKRAIAQKLASAVIAKLGS